jgi:hypothetical protein
VVACAVYVRQGGTWNTCASAADKDGGGDGLWMNTDNEFLGGSWVWMGVSCVCQCLCIFFQSLKKNIYI